MQHKLWRHSLLASCALLLCLSPLAAQTPSAPAKAEAPSLPPLPASDAAINAAEVIPLPPPGEVEKVDMKAIEDMLRQESGQPTAAPTAPASPAPVPATPAPVAATPSPAPAVPAIESLPPLAIDPPAVPIMPATTTPNTTPTPPAPAAATPTLPAVTGTDLPAVTLPEPTKKDTGVPELFDIPTLPPAEQTSTPAEPVKKEDVKTAKPVADPKKLEEGSSASKDASLPVPPPPPLDKSDSDSSKKKEKKKKNDTSMQTRRGGSLHNNYKTQILPEAIYQRQYDDKNKHLPKAVYYTDYEHQFFSAVARGDLGAIHAFLGAGVDLSVRNDQGDTPLLHAVRHQRLNIAQLLISRGARVNELDANGISASHMAVLMGNSDLVSMLGKKGANFDIMDVDGRTPLMYAVNNNNYPLVAALLESGAPPNTSMASGQTALHIAAARGNQALVQLLLQHGAITSARDNSGLTPQDHAYYYGQPHLVEMLTPSASNFNASGTPIPVNKPAVAAPNSPSVKDLRMQGGSSAFFNPQQPYPQQPPSGYPQPIGAGNFR